MPAAYDLTPRTSFEDQPPPYEALVAGTRTDFTSTQNEKTPSTTITARHVAPPRSLDPWTYEIITPWTYESKWYTEASWCRSVRSHTGFALQFGGGKRKSPTQSAPELFFTCALQPKKAAVGVKYIRKCCVFIARLITYHVDVLGKGKPDNELCCSMKQLKLGVCMGALGNKRSGKIIKASETAKDVREYMDLHDTVCSCGCFA